MARPGSSPDRGDSSRPPIDPRASSAGLEAPLERTTRVAEEGRAEARAVRSDLVALTDRVEELETLVGRVPSALPGDKGSGYGQQLVDLTAAVNALRAEMERDREERKREADARAKELAEMAKRREPWGRTAWLALGAAIAVFAGGGAQALLHWLSTLHH